MLKLLTLTFAVFSITNGQYQRPQIFQPIPPFQHYPNSDFELLNPYPNFDFDNRIKPYNLCTYTDVAFSKCVHTVQVAQENLIPLNLECVKKENRVSCIRSVETGTSDMVVLTGHGYKDARSQGLFPMIFAKENDSSLFIAVVPRNLTLIELQEASIYIDQNNHRAFHAAAFFNLIMDHDICDFVNKASLGAYISIVDSSNYIRNSEEILVCPNRMPAEFEDYKNCNIEAGLQRAVFVRSNLPPMQQEGVHKVFNTILQNFGPHSELDNAENEKPFKPFNFFDTFEGQENVIFKNNIVSFDFQPTYRNGIDEKVFDQLHCNNDEQPHDPSVLA